MVLIFRFRSSWSVEGQDKTEPISTWHLEEGYKSNRRDIIPYPLRVNGAGPLFGITIILKVNDYDIDYMCSGPDQGFKITFTTPFELPHAMKNYFELLLEMSSIYTIEPKFVETADSARKYPPAQRQCYFNSERKLRFFKQYTLRNCEYECLSNYTLAKCNCVPYSLLRMLIINCNIIRLVNVKIYF